MKKRVFSLLLSLCLVASLFACMAGTAFADDDTIQVTLGKGDTVARICETLGINFNANKEWIMKTNNISNFATLAVGRVLTLPAPGKVLTYVAPTSGPVTTTTTTSATATSSQAQTIQYTLKAGDYLINVCNALGIDFKANEEWIKAANNISNFNNLKAGRTLTLPAPGTTPALTTLSATNAVSATPLSSTASAASANLLSGDTLSYYLVSYVTKSGDTLFNICQSFGAKMETVQSINSIANAAQLKLGQTLLIPTATAPTSGTFIKVVAHKVVAKDTVLGICSSYGVSYEASSTLIQNLNNKTNLNAIKVGQTLLIPVPATAATAATTLPSSVTTTTVTTTPSTTTTAQTTGQYYTLNLTGAVNGTYALTVNGQSVNSANAGQTVHVVTTPDHGFMLSQITVLRDTDSTVVDVDGNNNFIMPDCNVRISVSFALDQSAQPHSVYNSSATQQNVIAIVNGVNQTSVEPGQTVKIVLSTLQTGKALDRVVVSTVNPYSRNQVINNTIDASSIVALSADYSFVMPAADVFVTVILKDE